MSVHAVCERDVHEREKKFLVCLLNTSSKISNFTLSLSCEVHKCSEKEKQTVTQEYYKKYQIHIKDRRVD